MTDGNTWSQRLREALSQTELTNKKSLPDIQAQAEEAHRAMVRAEREGRHHDAFEIAAALEPFASTVYADDPASQHAIWNDYGSLLFERGARAHAASVLRSALVAHHRWVSSNDRRDGAAIKQDLGLLHTLTTLMSVLTTFKDFEECELLHRQGLDAAYRREDRSEAHIFCISWGAVLAAQGNTGEAECVLREHLQAAQYRPVLRLQLFRVAVMLGGIYIRRRRYDYARASLERATELLDRESFPQDAADLESYWAILYFKLAAEDIHSDLWRRASQHNSIAAALRASSPKLSPSAGCAEENLSAIMALREGRIAEGRRHLAKCLHLARTVWTRDDPPLQESLLTGVGFALAADRPEVAARRTYRILVRLNAENEADQDVLLHVLPEHAEALRRSGRPLEAANALEDVLDLETKMVERAVQADWSPYDVTLVRRSHGHLNAFVDAVLATDGSDTLQRSFSRIAASKDLGIRTLRRKRGAAPPILKLSTLVPDLAAALPKGSSYVEFFVHLPRRPAGARTQWGMPRVLAFTLNSDDESSFRFHDLGPAHPLERKVASLAGTNDLQRWWSLAQLGWALRSVVEATHGDTVFIAPDGFLHNLPFAALPRRRGRWIRSARIALVESVATVLRPTDEGGSLSGATVVTADRVGDDDRPYKPIPAARDEGVVVAGLLRTTPHHLGEGAGSADELRKRLNGSYGVVHVAAHAEVLREPRGRSWAPDRAAYLRGLFDPYAQCRIICGGFNAWAKGRFGTPEDVDQVSLSAFDLAGINLHRVRLLTLSSCSGAAGDVQPLESSASLATAARAAGAGAVVAALWHVPDIDTRDLMVNLYWLEPATGSSVEALRQAQLKLKARGLGAWAGFVIWAGPDDLARLRRRPD